MSTLLLAAVVGSWVEPGVTLSANHLVAVVLLGQNLHRWLNDTSTKPQHQVESRLFLDVVVTQSPTIFKLLPRKNKSLLIWRDSFLVLNLRLYILNRIARFNVKSDGLAGQRLDEYLHLLYPSRYHVSLKGDVTAGRRTPL